MTIKSISRFCLSCQKWTASFAAVGHQLRKDQMFQEEPTIFAAQRRFCVAHKPRVKPIHLRHPTTYSADPDHMAANVNKQSRLKSLR